MDCARSAPAFQWTTLIPLRESGITQRIWQNWTKCFLASRQKLSADEWVSARPRQTVCPSLAQFQMQTGHMMERSAAYRVIVTYICRSEEHTSELQSRPHL